MEEDAAAPNAELGLVISPKKENKFHCFIKDPEEY